MKIKLMVTGKTDEPYLIEGIEKYLKRLVHYIPFEMVIIPDLKHQAKGNVEKIKEQEGKVLLQKLHVNDYVVLLDEKGNLRSSEQFSQWVQKKMNSGATLVFVIGGPYGFSEEIYERANEKMSLSPMTFSHQMVRLFFTEQLYRAFTILKGEKYHHL
jgi:23S rRNA (pseudouridine1915-N3)-methyltransferase